MIEELSQVVLTEDLPEHGLKAGDVGTVVLVHRGGEGCEVELYGRRRQDVSRGDAIQRRLQLLGHTRPRQRQSKAAVVMRREHGSLSDGQS